MEFEWDEAKRLSKIDRHGIGFEEGGESDPGAVNVSMRPVEKQGEG